MEEAVLAAAVGLAVGERAGDNPPRRFSPTAPAKLIVPEGSKREPAMSIEIINPCVPYVNQNGILITCNIRKGRSAGSLS